MISEEHIFAALAMGEKNFKKGECVMEFSKGNPAAVEAGT